MLALMLKSEDLLRPMFNMFRLVADYKFYLFIMKKLTLLSARSARAAFLLALVPTVTFTSCSDDDPVVPEEEVSIVTFDGDKWNALIDSSEYGGALLYGQSDNGFDEGETVYSWTDAETTLHSTLNAGSYGTAFWSGGTAVSNYHAAIADAGYTKQLSIPTELAAHSGSNFLVAYGYDSSKSSLDFADKNPRKVKGLWVTNTSYFLNAETIGGYNAPATAQTTVDVVFEGFDAQGVSTGTVKQRLQDGTTPLTAWTYVDLSSLGKVASLTIDFAASADQFGDYGLNTPAYVAIDDIEVVQ